MMMENQISRTNKEEWDGFNMSSDTIELNKSLRDYLITSSVKSLKF